MIITIIAFLLTEGSTVFVGDDRIEGAWEQIIILLIYIIIMIIDHDPSDQDHDPEDLRDGGWW